MSRFHRVALAPFSRVARGFRRRRPPPSRENRASDVPSRPDRRASRARRVASVAAHLPPSAPLRRPSSRAGSRSPSARVARRRRRRRPARARARRERPIQRHGVDGARVAFARRRRARVDDARDSSTTTTRVAVPGVVTSSDRRLVVVPSSDRRLVVVPRRPARPPRARAVAIGRGDRWCD